MKDDCSGLPQIEIICALEEQLAAMTKERDALEYTIGIQAPYAHQLAAKDAVIERLRNALEDCQKYLASDWTHVTAATEALAIPNDDSALQERLKEERERCAKVCAEVGQTLGSILAESIRSMT